MTPGRRGLAPLGRATCLFALGVACVGASGCGNARTRPPSLAVAARPNGFRALIYPAQGLSLEVPRDWSVLPGRAPLLGTISSGPAVAALWRYARTGAPPDGAALQHALALLVRAVRARDSTLRLLGARTLRVDRAPAVEIDAVERVSGVLRRVRSTHVYLPGGEIVLDEYAPVESFQLVDHLAFSPIKRSLTVGRKSPAPR